MTTVREALSDLIAAHDPYPAVVVDRTWDIVMANTGAQAFLDGVAAHLVAPPGNVYRITLHPDGMSRRIENLAEWAHHLLATLDRQVAVTRDPRLRALLDEVSGYPNLRQLGAAWRTRSARADDPRPAAPARAGRTVGAVQSWFSTNTSIGTPVDITLEELHVELFHPADRATAAMVAGPDRRARTSGRGASQTALWARSVPFSRPSRPVRTPAPETYDRPTVGAVTIAPEISDEEAAAIVAAVEVLWPRLVAVPDVDARRASVWRFSGRWWTQPIPLRRARPWM